MGERRHQHREEETRGGSAEKPKGKTQKERLLVLTRVIREYTTYGEQLSDSDGDRFGEKDKVFPHLMCAPP